MVSHVKYGRVLVGVRDESGWPTQEERFFVICNVPIHLANHGVQ